MQRFFVKIRRRETPFYSFLHDIASRIRRISIPQFCMPLYKVLYNVRIGIIIFFRGIAVFLYYEPMFRSACRKVGRKFQYVKLRQGFPYIYGNIQIYLGDNVIFHSRASLSAGKVFDLPTFEVGSNTYLGPGLSIGVSKKISVGAFCYVASNVSISDNDGHPLDPLKRSKGDPVDKKDVLPVHIGDYVWIGEGATILKGVSIGEGSVVAARSVVVRDVEPYSVVAGNPAKFIKWIENDEKNLYRSLE